jgi:hypothetical protein
VISRSIFNSMQIPPASIAGAAALLLTAVALHAQNPLPFRWTRASRTCLRA